jgi:RNA-splicing ligase RtcB|tara:strand:- start:1333 stop:1584 length:252 start_codon:yes stop_codon:yes gene_type:complete
MSINSDWSNFLHEDVNVRTIFTYIQGLQEVINNLKPKTVKEQNRLTLAKQHLREIRRHARRMLNENADLHERLTLLEESKGAE